MRINGSDLSVTLVGGLTCVFMYVGIPLWAVFIGWAWYYVMGSRPKAIKQGVPPTLAGAVLAILGLLIIDWLTPGMGSELATGVGLLVTMFLLMLFFKIPGCGATLPGFNAYSCYFVGFSAQSYVPVAGMNPYLNAFIWITGANILGLVVGWGCVVLERLFDRWLGTPVAARTASEHNQENKG